MRAGPRRSGGKWRRPTGIRFKNGADLGEAKSPGGTELPLAERACHIAALYSR